MSARIPRLLQVVIVIALTLAWCHATASAQAPQLDQTVAAIKKSMAESQVRLKQYEWIETTVISIKGEEKSRQQHRCYHGADGGIQKVPVTAEAPPEKPRGIRGKIAEKKKEELTDSMKQAVALVKSYVPPTPEAIEANKAAGNVSIDVLDPGKRMRVNFKNYVKNGDKLGIEMDMVNQKLLTLSVDTWMSKPEEAVTMTAKFASLDDGTTYLDAVRLDLTAEKLAVSVDNSGYRKMGK